MCKWWKKNKDAPLEQPTIFILKSITDLYEKIFKRNERL
jgi:hypothetical protein